MEMFDANGNVEFHLSAIQIAVIGAYYQWFLPQFYNATDYIRDHQQTMLMLGGLCVFILIVHWWDTRYDRRRRWNLVRGKAMNEQERQAYLDSLMADIICDGIEEAVHDGKMSGQEAARRYSQFAKRFNLKDLMPRSNKKQQAKLKATLAKKWFNGKEAAHKQTPKNQLHATLLKYTPKQ